MLPSNALYVSVFNETTELWEDVTSGILAINTSMGSDYFEGYWEQPDVGQFTLVSRGATVDPHLNDLIKQNALLRFASQSDDEFSAFFYGFITDINVKYNKNDKQTVTINGSDLIGYLNRLVITDDFVATYVTPDYPDGLMQVGDFINLIDYALPGYGTAKDIFSISYVSRDVDFTGAILGQYVATPATPIIKVEASKTFYELLASGMSTGLMRYYNYIGPADYIFVPNVRYDDQQIRSFQNELFPIALKTNADDPWQNPDIPEEFVDTYKFVNINNGINQIINQVAVTNTDPATEEMTTVDPLSNTDSVQEYGPALLDAQTGFTTTLNPFWLPTSTIAGQAAEYQDNVIDYQSIPSTKINSVTADYSQVYIPSIYTGRDIFVQHRLENDTYIYGNYQIAGFKHNITQQEWLVEMILQESEESLVTANKPKEPVIDISPSNGTTATTFTASISNYTTEDLANIDRIEWFVNMAVGESSAVESYSPPSHLYKYNPNLAKIGASFPDVHIFTGTTASWNYDNLGLLAGYSDVVDFGSNDNPFLPAWPADAFGPGSYQVQVWVRNKQGFTTRASHYVSVSQATVTADFDISVDQYGVVTFTDQSSANAETWSWNFGDGTTYTGENPPTKVYTTAGTYYVTLTVTDGTEFDSFTQPVTITSINIPVRYVKFSFDGTVTKASGATSYSDEILTGLGPVSITSTTSSTVRNPYPPLYLINGDPLEAIYSSYQVQNIPNTAQVTGQRYSGDTYWPLYNSDGTPMYTPYYAQTDVYPYWMGAGSLQPFKVEVPNGSGGTTEEWVPLSFPDQSTYNVNLHELNDPVTDPMKNDLNTNSYHYLLPVVTDNPDGSQTKSINAEFVVEYSKLFYPENSEGDESAVVSWGFWDTTSGTVSTRDQRYKVQSITAPISNISDVKAYANTYGSSQFTVYDFPDTNKAVGTTYAPVTVSISADGLIYRKVGTITFTTNGTDITQTMTYVVSGTTSPTGTLPPKSTLPIYP